MNNVGTRALLLLHCKEEIRNALRLALDPKKPYAIFDFPNHSNVGDSAIWQGEIKALDRYFNCSPILTFELPQNSMPLPELPVDTQIVLNGGGNIGDIWENMQLFRERVIKNFPDNRIVQMPQSIFFRNEKKKDRCRQVFSAHKDFLLMVRDKTSFQIATTLHEGRTELVPDMALALGRIPRPCAPATPILGLLRTDQEKTVADDAETLKKIKAVDWIEEPAIWEGTVLRRITKFESILPFPRSLLDPLKTKLFNRISKIRVRRGCSLLSEGHVVITDRLHAHILCTLMEIPHVILDNSYGKLSSFRKAWRTGTPALCLEASTLKEAYQKAEFLLAQNSVHHL